MMLLKKIKYIEGKIPYIANLATTTSLNAKLKKTKYLMLLT